MRLPYSVQGFFFGPALVGLFVLLKSLCPASFGQSCLSDYFAAPIFLPLIAVYKFFGSSAVIFHQELVFILLYWALVGAFLGFVVDLLGHKRGSSSPAPTIPRQTVPPSIPKPVFSSAPIAPLVTNPLITQKPPLNMLDRPEFKD